MKKGERRGGRSRGVGAEIEVLDERLTSSNLAGNDDVPGCFGPRRVTSGSNRLSFVPVVESM